MLSLSSSFFNDSRYCCALDSDESISGVVVVVGANAVPEAPTVAAVPEASDIAAGCLVILRLLEVVEPVVVVGNRFVLVAVLFGFAMTRTGLTLAIVEPIPVIALTSVGTDVLAGTAVSSENGAGASEIGASSWRGCSLLVALLFDAALVIVCLTGPAFAETWG